MIHRILKSVHWLVLILSILILFSCNTAGVAEDQTTTRGEIDNVQITAVDESISVSWDTTTTDPDLTGYLIVLTNQTDGNKLERYVVHEDNQTYYQETISTLSGAYTGDISLVFGSEGGNNYIASNTYQAPTSVLIQTSKEQPPTPLLNIENSVLVENEEDNSISLNVTLTVSNANDAEYLTFYWAEGDSVDIWNYTGLQEILVSDTTTLNVYELKENTAYAFMAVSTNNNGLEAKSASVLLPALEAQNTDPEISVLPQDISVAATEDVASIHIYLSANPGTTINGDPVAVSRYVLYWKAGDRVSETDVDGTIEIVDINAEDKYSANVTIENLALDTLYSIMIVAENSLGRIARQTISQMTPSEITLLRPSPVANVQLTESILSHTAGQIDVTWEQPENPGTHLVNGNIEPAEIVSYLLYWQEGAEVTTENATLIEIEETGAVPQQTVTLRDGVYSGKEYSVILIAKNTAGIESTPTDITSITVTSSKKSAPSSVQKETYTMNIDTQTNQPVVTISWENPDNLGSDYLGRAVTLESYTVYWQSGSEVSTENYLGTPMLVQEPRAVLNLLLNTDYTVMVVVRNDLGLDSANNAVIPFAVDEPQPLTTLAATPGPEGSTVALSWNAPTDFGTAGMDSATLETYHIYVGKGTEVNTDGPAQHTYANTDTALTYTIPGLEGATDYTIAVVVENSLNLKSTERIINVTTNSASTAPGQLSDILVDTSHTVNKEMKLYWTPVSKGKDASGTSTAFSTYRVYYALHSDGYTEGTIIDNPDVPVITTSDENEQARVSVVLPGLESAREYDVAVVAINSADPTKTSQYYKGPVGTSNGVTSLTLEIGGLDAGSSITKAVGDESFEISANILLNNVDGTVIWTQTDAEVATISINTHRVSVRPNKAGTTVITASSSVDSTKTDSIELVVKENISQYAISYGSELTFDAGKETVIDVESASLPADMVLANISIALTPATDHISINPDNGTITISAVAADGVYTAIVTVTAAENDGQYTGSTSTEFSIVLRDVSGYKQWANSISRTLFTFGDVGYTTNPYLFTVDSAPEDLRKLGGTISIVSLHDPSIVSENSIYFSSFTNANNERIVGAGIKSGISYTERKGLFNSYPIDPSATADIALTISLKENGKEFFTATKNLRRAEFGDVYEWTDFKKNVDFFETTWYTLQQDITFPAVNTLGFDEGITYIMANGKVDGNGKSIFNMTLSSTLSDVGFHYTRTPLLDNEIKNITFVNPQVTGDSNVSVLGYAKTISNISIVSEDINTDSVMGADSVAGVIARTHEGFTATNITTTNISVRASTGVAAGAFSYMVKPKGIENIKVIGNINSVLGAGGIAYSVYAHDGIFSASYKGDIINTDAQGVIGGLVGKYTNDIDSSLSGINARIQGYTTQSIIQGTGSSAGLIANIEVLSNDTVTVLGYADAHVSGDSNVGGLIGSVSGEGTQNIIGYHIGSLTGSNNVGGLLGERTADTTTVSGYSRSTLNRNDNSTGSAFGYLVGASVTATNVTGYYSTNNTMSGIESTEATGILGLSIQLTSSTTRDSFSDLDFTNYWVWQDGHWPAVNLVVASEQPIAP